MNNETKICTKCGVEKSVKLFSARNSKQSKCGIMSWCKRCASVALKQWRKKNPDKHRGASKKWAENNPQKIQAYKKEYRKTHREIIRAGIQSWKNNNKDRVRESGKKWRQTPQGNLCNRMASSIRHSLGANKAGRTWESLVGYSVWDLQVHLQSKFIIGMTWDRFLKGEIHIDHIIPKSRFHYETPDDPEFKVCWGLNNLQPLWGKDNLSKGSELLQEQNQ